MKMKLMLRSVLATIGLTIVASAANALALAPVKMLIVAGQHATAITLTNNDSSTRTFDLRMNAWLGNDANGGAALGPQTRVLISRPVVTLAPGASSTVRVAAAERSRSGADYYRLILSDITPPVPGEARVAVNFSLPLEVVNTKSATGVLAAVDGVITNTGTAAVFVSGLRRQGTEPDSSIHRYLLPGERWTTQYSPDQLVWSSGIL